MKLLEKQNVNFTLYDNGNPIDRIMLFFIVSKDSSKNSNRYLDLERKEFNKNEYSGLGWDSNRYFDVINSFWFIFSSILNLNIGFIPYKPSYPHLYFKTGKGKIHQLDDVEKLKELADYCHTVANFMPCPDEYFNRVKGSDVCDFLPLMIDKIEELKNQTIEFEENNGSKTIIEISKWHKWFIENREKYHLEMYYDIEDTGTEKIIEGKKFFKGQTLENPLPATAKEASICLDNMIKCINKRNEEFEKDINNKD